MLFLCKKKLEYFITPTKIIEPFVLAVQNFEKIATFVLKYKNIKYSKKPGTFSGFFTIPEKNKKNFRYCIDNGKLFWYSINTGRKIKKLPVFPERGVSDE